MKKFSAYFEKVDIICKKYPKFIEKMLKMWYKFIVEKEWNMSEIKEAI